MKKLFFAIAIFACTAVFAVNAQDEQPQSGSENQEVKTEKIEQPATAVSDSTSVVTEQKAEVVKEAAETATSTESVEQ